MVYPGIDIETFLVGGALLLAGGLAFYAIQTVVARGDESDENAEAYAALKRATMERDRVALLVPAGTGIDALAAAAGVQALCNEWGVATQVFADDEPTGEDGRTFCGTFDIDVGVVDDSAEDLAACGGAIIVGGDGRSPRVPTLPLVAVISHRQLADGDVLTITNPDDGATSTTVANLVRAATLVPDQRIATALLYGIRVGTREFRRAKNDYGAAEYLHPHANLSRIEELRAPGMSNDAFDLVGRAIADRERRSSFVVANVGEVPSMGALEEGSDSLLQLEGVSTAAAFGVHEETIVIACRAEDVRSNAMEILQSAFAVNGTTVGNVDTATTRVPLGLFAAAGSGHEGTVGDLIDRSTRKSLFAAFESA